MSYRPPYVDTQAVEAQEQNDANEARRRRRRARLAIVAAVGGAAVLGIGAGRAASHYNVPQPRLWSAMTDIANGHYWAAAENVAGGPRSTLRNHQEYVSSGTNNSSVGEVPDMVDVAVGRGIQAHAGPQVTLGVTPVYRAAPQEVERMKTDSGAAVGFAAAPASPVSQPQPAKPKHHAAPRRRPAQQPKGKPPPKEGGRIAMIAAKPSMRLSTPTVDRKRSMMFYTAPHRVKKTPEQRGRGERGPVRRHSDYSVQGRPQAKRARLP